MDPLYRIILGVIALSLGLAIWGIWRRRGRLGLSYMLLLGINAAFALKALGEPQWGLSAILAFALFVLWIVIPSLLASISRRALQRGDVDTALRLIRIRLFLQPGAGLEREQDVLRGLRLVRQGRIDEAVADAEAALARPARADSTMQLALLDRLLTLYLYAQRWDDAVRLFERHGGLLLAKLAPGIAANIVRAYAELGRLAEAGQLHAILEQSPMATDPLADELTNGARLSLLAHAGRVSDVERLLEEGSGFLPQLSDAQRRLWRGVAHARAGQRARAEELWQSVADMDSDLPAQKVAVKRLHDALAPASMAIADETWASLCEAVAERALAHRSVPRGSGRLWAVAPVTMIFIGLVVAVHVALVLTGRGDDPWMLIRFGANFADATLQGQPWRLVSSIFVHGGWLHLILNGYALLLLGRFVEQIYGSARFFSLFVAAGTLGALASAVLGREGHLSVGASGAIFGLLGAAVVGLRQLQGQVPEPWRKRLLINLFIVIGLQLYIGYTVTVIDNAAHIGGLLSGAAIALVLRNRRARHGASGWGYRLAAGAFAALLLYSAASVATTSAEATLASLPLRTFQRGGLRVEGPRHWREVSLRQTVDEAGLALQDPLNAVGPTLLVLRPFPLLAGELDTLPVLADSHTQMFLDHVARDADATLSARRLADDQPFVAPANVAQTAIAFTHGGLHYTQLHLFRRERDYLLIAILRLPDSDLPAYRTVITRLAASMTFVE